MEMAESFQEPLEETPLCRSDAMRQSALLRMMMTLLLCITVSSMQQLFAQSATGSLRGVVADPSGAVVPGATIGVVGLDGTKASAQSGADGSYQFEKLVPGTYSLSATAPGFYLAQTLTVKVHGGQAAELNVPLT